MIRPWCLLLVSLFALSGCVTSIPLEEYSLARAAYTSAKDWDAPRYASAQWFNAEQAYREGQKAYKERRYDVARGKFIEARNFSEQAENAARLERHQSGDVLP